MFAHFTNQNVPRNILLIRFGTVKDTVCTLPIIHILRIRYPFAKIAWFATGEMVNFLNDYNIVDRIILAKPGWQKNLCEIKSLRRRFRNFAPDLCLDLQGNFAGSMAAKLSGCRNRFSTRGHKKRIFWRTNRLHQSPATSLQENLQMLESLDIAGASLDYDLPVIPIESHTAGWLVRELGLESTPFAILGVGVQSHSTYWETNRYVQTARHLTRACDMPVVVAWQTEQEKQLAETIVAESGEMTMLMPGISATQFTALARRAAVHIGVDNDLLHIAAAVGTPAVGIFRDDTSLYDAPVCENFRHVSTQTPRTRSGKTTETAPVRIDNYTYDVIEICNICDELFATPASMTLPCKHASVVPCQS